MKKWLIVLFLIILGTGFLVFNKKDTSLPLKKDGDLKLYWFIPDGVRAEPSLFQVYEWAKQGKLPNIYKLMQNGSFGYSYPNFPSHTPTNFATLLTGSYPEVHGVDDGPMREIGKPLDKVAVGGFRSVAKKVPAIWKTLEDAGLKIALLSIPGSTPPDLNKGVVLKGRWGGWGADFHAINFETKGNLAQRILQGRAVKLFFFGPPLTQYLDPQTPTGWENPPTSHSDPYELTLTGWGTDVFAYVYDSTDDSKENYDKVVFSLDKKDLFADLNPGEWSDWHPITLKWKVEDQTTDIDTSFKATVIKLDSDKFFRIRLFYDNLNKTLTFPAEAAEQLQEKTGPMVDFADNFPAQLIYYPEDKKTFMQEADMSFDWHTKAVGGLFEKFKPQVVIQDIYTPNQMLTSRWWMGHVDPKGMFYKTTSDQDREKLWQEVQDIYVKLDNIVGEIFKVADSNTYIVFSSDHGNVPLNHYVNLNNLFAQKGWLKFQIDPQTGEPIIDWENSTVIYLKMAHVYVNPNGLAGDYTRASGPEYENLRNQVKQALSELQDENGVKPVAEIVDWENAKEFMQLDPDRIGDLVIANTTGYGWNEEMTKDLKIFATPLVSGYKQAIKAKDEPGMWTPFIIAGPGIKKNNFLGDEPFSLVDQYPTLMKALKVESPSFIQGKPLPVFE